MENNQTVTRINKYLSEIGYCSRREADRLIADGRVLVNGEPVEMGLKVSAEDKIVVNGEAISNPKNKLVYIAFNKPKGIVCTTDTRVEKDNIIDYINYSKRIFPIGRLDKASEGLIFLTNDGDIVNEILRAEHNHEKEYIVSVDRNINDQFIAKMSKGIPILGTKTKPCIVEKLENKVFRIILTQGLNRQIRRMCEFLHYNVLTLKRVRIMNITLDKLKVGEWRDLSADELNGLKALIKETKN